MLEAVADKLHDFNLFQLFFSQSGYRDFSVINIVGVAGRYGQVCWSVCLFRPEVFLRIASFRKEEKMSGGSRREHQKKEGRRWRSTGHVGRRVFHKNCWNCWKVPEEFSSSHHKKCKKSLRISRWAIAANFFLPTSLWPQVCCAGVQEVERCCW